MKLNKVKRISAIIGIVLIASLYIISLFTAFFASNKAPGMFLASAFCTVVIPIMIYCFIAVYKRVHKDDLSNETEGNGNTDSKD